MASSLTKHDIIFIASEPWKYHICRRRHHVAWRLAKENRVLWISPVLPSLGMIFRRLYHLRHYKRKVMFDLGRLKHQGRNLWTYCPVSPLPTWNKIPAIARFNERFVQKDVRRIARKLDIQSPILWLHRNQSTQWENNYFGLFKEKLSVLDIFEPIVDYDVDWLNDDGQHPALEWTKRAIRNTNIVFAVSKELCIEARKLNDNSYLIPHGVNYTLFKSPPKVTPAPMLQRIKKPVLGFLGLMHHKVDFDLLNDVATNRPDWSILLMGRDDSFMVAETMISFKALTRKQNAHYVGEIQPEQIPYYLQHVDVCMIPFKKTRANRYEFGPLKLLEYLAAGRPVVAVDQGIKY